jgi:DNA (cytosine-5)-methyltransferase 1
VSNTTYATIDLFAGIGGIRKGFEATGRFRTIYANDFDKHCKLTYDANFKNTPLTVKDIHEVGLVKDGVEPFDFLLGGFPCQAFSVAGHKQGLDDHKGRGILFEEIERLLKEAADTQTIPPQGFMLENVKNLLNHDNKRTYPIIKQRLEALGYHLDERVYNSLDFGVPQNRERVYIVGFRSPEVMAAFKWPEIPGRGNLQVQDLLDSEVDPVHYYEGKPLYDRIKDYVTSDSTVYQYRRNYVRENAKGVSPTLMANMGMGGHNVPIIKDAYGIRRLTPSECGRLQGYNNLVIPAGLSYHQIYRQIGNSVTVPVINAVAEAMLQALDSVKNKKMSIPEITKRELVSIK